MICPNLLLQALATSRGLVSLQAEDLVDGDRERTLALLWALALQQQLPQLVRPATLKAELARVLARQRSTRALGEKAQQVGDATRQRSSFQHIGTYDIGTMSSLAMQMRSSEANSVQCNLAYPLVASCWLLLLLHQRQRLLPTC